MKRSLFLVLLLTSLAWGVTGPGFAFTNPTGWVETTMPGMKYKLTAGPPSGGFAPNINVVDENANVTMAVYVTKSKETLVKMIPGCKITGEAAFTTTAGVKGVKVATRSKQQGKDLAQTFYVFPGKGTRKFVVTCSAGAAVAGKLAPTFDKAMKSFVVK